MLKNKKKNKNLAKCDTHIKSIKEFCVPAINCRVPGINGLGVMISYRSRIHIFVI